MSFLEISGVSKSYGEGADRTDVLEDINLKVEEGEFIAIVGFSGTGKTTLISLLAGLIEADAGGVIFKGKEIDGPSPDRGVVFQSYSLMPWLSVTGNVALAVDTVFRKKSAKERKAICDKYIEMVGLAHGRVIVRAQVTERAQRGTVFVPMHWTDQVSSNGRVDTVVAPDTDPVSGQPGSKFTPVALRKLELEQYGFAVMAQSVQRAFEKSQKTQSILGDRLE